MVDSKFRLLASVLVVGLTLLGVFHSAFDGLSDLSHGGVSAHEATVSRSVLLPLGIVNRFCNLFRAVGTTVSMCAQGEQGWLASFRKNLTGAPSWMKASLLKSHDAQAPTEPESESGAEDDAGAGGEAEVFAGALLDKNQSPAVWLSRYTTSPHKTGCRDADKGDCSSSKCRHIARLLRGEEGIFNRSQCDGGQVGPPEVLQAGADNRQDTPNRCAASCR